MLEQLYTTKNNIHNIVQEIAQCFEFAITIKSSSSRHFYLQSKDARVFSEHCQLTRDAKCIAVQMLKAGAKPSMIYEAIRNKIESQL
ncbi:12211_t:CDS:2 [Gigaspora margarita]|uniref:12211_t:CDS:1 n=1 Tax=Gigaspora margarita TaxID=4874 RepID=A0ABN7UHZ8_GIGMA|nr:12211_t:CDS:2 [Gigaspora margarita]